MPLWRLRLLEKALPDHLQFGRIRTSFLRARLRAAAFKHAQAEQAVQILFKSGADQGVPHLAKSMDRRLIVR